MSTKETPQTIDPYLVISQIEKLLAQLKLENAEKNEIKQYNINNMY